MLTLMGTPLHHLVFDPTETKDLSSIKHLMEETENSPSPDKDHRHLSDELDSIVPSKRVCKASICSYSRPLLGFRLSDKQRSECIILEETVMDLEVSRE
nr:hypothetical protein [Tanacetum cinerariifolium]